MVNSLTSSIRLNNTVLPSVTWTMLEKLDADLEGTGARLVYLDGDLEILAPLSDEHEEPKKRLAQLLETYMRLQQIRFYAKGSTMIGMKDPGARKEPDESYCIGQLQSIPHLALEITVTSGGVNVLAIYERIGVQEVWFWEDGLITIHALRPGGYELIPRSELLPQLDVRSVEFHSRMADQFDAINSFMDELQRISGSKLID